MSEQGCVVSLQWPLLFVGFKSRQCVVSGAMSNQRSRDGNSAMTQLTVSIPNEIYDEITSISDWASGTGTQVSKAVIVREALAHDLTNGYPETNYIAKYQREHRDYMQEQELNDSDDTE